MYRTQKARGVAALYSEVYTYLRSELGLVSPPPGPVFVLPHDTTPLASKWPMFARPCPKTPRHGFLESRMVYDEKEANKILAETLAIDPEGEVILMPICTGRFSAVVTNAGITWGHYHNGVTDGSALGNSFIPTPVSPNDWREIATSMNLWRSHDREKWAILDSDVSDDHIPYIELVEHEGSVTTVQMRAGPPQGTAQDFIPRQEKVSTIIESRYSNDDPQALLRWEKKIADLLEHNKGPEGIVYWARGKSLASHWAIHCIQNDIAVVTRDRPEVGDELTPTDNQVPPLTDGALCTLAKEIKNLQSKDYLGDGKDMLLPTMGTIHACSFWGEQDHLLLFRALAVENIVRYISAACLGEARHFHSYGPGRRFRDPYEDEDTSDYESYLDIWRDSRGQTSAIPWDTLKLKNWKSPTNAGRSNIYEAMLQPRSPLDRRNLMECARTDFSKPGWGNEDDDDDNGPSGNSSYGGRNWAGVTTAGLRLIDDVQTFLGSPTQRHWKTLIISLNNAMHVCHNGGAITGKWAREGSMNSVAEKPAFGFMNLVSAEIALGEWNG